MATDRLARARVTGVGSLPHRDADAAVAFVLDHAPLLPFWPQLPRRHGGESMVLQVLGDAARHFRPGSKPGFHAMDGADLGRVERDLESSPGWRVKEAPGLHSFAAALERREVSKSVPVKGQMIGPHTLALSLECDGAPPLSLLPAIVRRLESLLVRQVEMLAAQGHDVLLVLDEPALSVPWPGEGEASLESLRTLLRIVEGSGATSGLHCCGTVPRGSLSRLEPGILSFDALSFGKEVLTDPALPGWCAGGGRLALGLVGTTAKEGRPDDPEAVVEILVRAFGTETAFAEGAGSSLVTATCGLAGATCEGAARSFDRARAIARSLESRLSTPR